MVYLRVAGLAQAHEVLSCVSAALGNGQNVVYFLHRSQPTFLEALFTQRMLCGITVADTLPRSAVFAVDIGTAFVYMDKCGYDLLNRGVITGKYSFKYLGENVTVYLEDGIFKTGYGDYVYTYDELVKLL